MCVMHGEEASRGHAAALSNATTPLSLAVPLDHRVLSNRSRALLVMGKSQEALRDAEECCALKPLWPKVRVLSAK